MNINDSFPSPWLKSVDFNMAPTIVTIKSTEIETIGRDDPEEKPVCFFEEFDKPLILNKTNAMVLSDLFGAETTGWIGNKIVLSSLKVEAFGATHDAVRIRALEASEMASVTQQVQQAATAAAL